MHFILSSFNVFFPVRRCLSRYLSSSNTFNLLISPPRTNCRQSYSSNVFYLSCWLFLPLWAAVICNLCLRSFRCCTYSFTNFRSTANLVAKRSKDLFNISSGLPVIRKSSTRLAFKRLHIVTGLLGSGTGWGILSWLDPTQSCAWQKSHSFPPLLMQSFFRYPINSSPVL